MSTWRGTRELALNQRGITETPPGNNHNKFTEWYGITGPWCAMFISWVFAHSRPEPIIPRLMPKFAFTPLFADWYREHKRSFVDEDKAVSGDTVFYNFPDSLDRIQHVGLVLDNQRADKQLLTIEGNTSSGTSGSQDDGGGVFVRQRPYGSSIVVMGRNPYTPKEPPEPRFAFPDVRTYLTIGDAGADVKLLQQQLNKWSKWLDENRDKATEFGPFRLEADGEFGNQTAKALKTFQYHEELDVDGRAGRHTLKHLQKERRWQRAQSKQ